MAYNLFCIQITSNFCRPDLLGQLQVFEVDHSATQAFKRNRSKL